MGMHYKGFRLPLLAVAFSSACFSFILANALFLQTRCRVDEWFGKIWLKADLSEIKMGLEVSTHQFHHVRRSSTSSVSSVLSKRSRILP